MNIIIIKSNISLVFIRFAKSNAGSKSHQSIRKRSQTPRRAPEDQKKHPVVWPKHGRHRPACVTAADYVSFEAKAAADSRNARAKITLQLQLGYWEIWDIGRKAELPRWTTSEWSVESNGTDHINHERTAQQSESVPTDQGSHEPELSRLPSRPRQRQIHRQPFDGQHTRNPPAKPRGDDSNSKSNGSLQHIGQPEANVFDAELLKQHEWLLQEGQRVTKAAALVKFKIQPEQVEVKRLFLAIKVFEPKQPDLG